MKELDGGLYEDDAEDLFGFEPEQEDAEPEELSGELKWPQPDGESNNHQQERRSKYRDPEAVAAGLDGKPLVPQDFGSDEGIELVEQRMGQLYQLIFDRPVKGLKPEWRRAWQLAAERDGEGTVQVERVTNYPVMRSLQDISSDLYDEGIRVRHGENAGRAILSQQIQEWKLRSGIKAMVEYFFVDHREVLDAYLAKRKKNGETDICPAELLQRFVDGVRRLLAGQQCSSPSK